MRVCSLELFDFRNFTRADLALEGQFTALVGANGQGKTNLLEAIGFAGGLGSIRGAPDAALVRQGAEEAVMRCEAQTDAGRDVLIEVSLHSGRPNRFRLNRQRLKRKRDLFDALAVTVLMPDDLELVSGSPGVRRRWIDAAVAASSPVMGPLAGQLSRILRQRNALLRQTSGRLDAGTAITLDVWDSRLAEAGERTRQSREALLADIGPRLGDSYARVAAADTDVTVRYESSWGDEPLSEALAVARTVDLRRGASTVGPHRDEVSLMIDGRPARTHASRGEQRSLALAMRLAVDAAVRERRRVRPVMLLDDVFAELDRNRAAALLRALPEGQCILAASSALPEGANPDQMVRVHGGALSAAAPLGR